MTDIEILDKIKAIVDDYIISNKNGWLCGGDDNKTDFKAYFFDKILDVFANIPLRPQDADSNGDIIPMACKEEKGDLISREALRKAFHNRIYYFNKSSWDEANAIIDNAPTVNPLTDGIWEAYSKIMDCEFELSDGFWITTPKGKKIYFEKKRPQGEWITKGYEPYGRCNICGGICEINNFCGNCGADMKGEKMSELEKLEKYLKEHNYNYKWNSVCKGHEGYPYQDQIIVYDDHNTRIWDAVCHFGSYGHEKGLLEIMGVIVDEEADGDSVKGWLTADDVIKRLETKNE